MMLFFFSQKTSSDSFKAFQIPQQYYTSSPTRSVLFAYFVPLLLVNHSVSSSSSSCPLLLLLLFLHDNEVNIVLGDQNQGQNHPQLMPTEIPSIPPRSCCTSHGTRLKTQLPVLLQIACTCITHNEGQWQILLMVLVRAALGEEGCDADALFRGPNCISPPKCLLDL